VNTIRLEHVFPHPPARVWRFLTDAELLSRWLMPTDFRPELGAAFTFDAGQWGITRCEVLAIEPERLLRYSWRNPPLDTTITWTAASGPVGGLMSLEAAG
jgi:uncharacterized protein YndB with AHSA1/START domain